MITEFPCGSNLLINAKVLERSLKFIKQLIANEIGPLNDLVKNELMPTDRFQTSHS